jgi:small-conductance mechanosensitive channel
MLILVLLFLVSMSSAQGFLLAWLGLRFTATIDGTLFQNLILAAVALVANPVLFATLMYVGGRTKGEGMAYFGGLFIAAGFAGGIIGLIIAMLFRDRKTKPPGL